MNSSGDSRESAVAIDFLQRFLLDREQGQARSLTDYQAMFPSHPDVIAREYAHLVADNGAGDCGDADRYPGRGARYRNAEIIGRGGMGIVERVYDPSLGREVALKKLASTGGPTDERLLARFLAEARVTGQLQHPGIVSVIEIGLDDEERPYFTMPLIEGKSLHEVIAELHAGSRQWSQVRLLDVLVRVCEAMAYAHERGVVHRDLKPANVMIGRFGETYVVDWGLARVDGQPDHRDLRIHERDDNDAADDQPDSPLRTVEGDVLGTPAYMAPEQARGELDRIGPHGDVYAIGAMLYHLLTGAPPYSRPGETTSGRDTLHAVRDHAPPSVTSIATTTAAELVAICERAMARDPEHRYATASELGADLRAFLENRVVTAHATGTLAALRKWVRRNRALAAASTIALLALVGGFVWSETERRTADVNLTMARENLDLAFEAGDDLLGRFGLYELENVPGADPVREALTKRSLAYFERLRDLRGNDARIDGKVALAMTRIAQLQTQLGQGDVAAESWRAARTATERLLAQDGASFQLRHQLFQIDFEEQVRVLQKGDTKAAIAGLQRVGKTLAALRNERPGSRQLLRDACALEHNLANAMIAVRNKDGALTHTARVVANGRELITAADGSAAAYSMLGSALMLRGKLLWQLRRLDESEAAYKEARDLLETTLVDHPEHRGVRYRLGELLNLHAILQRQRKDITAAEASFERAAELFGGLAAENPGARNFQGNLGGALCNLGIVRCQHEDYDKAVELFVAARQHIDAALAIDRAASDFKGYRRIVAVELSLVYLHRGQHAEAATETRALAEQVPGENDFKVGQLLAICAKICPDDKALSEKERGRLSREYADEAMRFLQAAAAAGSIPKGTLKGAAFDPMRNREDFQALVEKAGR